MAKRGDQARESVKNTIIDAFTKDGNFVAFQDKKIYVQAKDGANGEIIQFAISMTMPKTPIAATGTADPANDWRDESSTVINTPTELSPEDKEKVHELMRRLNIE